MKPKYKAEPEIMLSDGRGQYIPRDFVDCLNEIHRNKLIELIGLDDVEVLMKGPIIEGYWDIWAKVCDNFRLNDGVTEWFLYQDGNLWIIPVGMHWDEETDFWAWPKDEEAQHDEE